MDVESLLRRSDPLRDVDVPRHNSAVGERIRDQVLSRPLDDGGPMDDAGIPGWVRRPLRIPLAGAALAIASVVVLLVTLLPGPDGPEPSGAAAALSRFASHAAAAPPTVLGPGQYDYTETESQTYTIAVGASSPGEPGFDEYLTGTVQTWVAADGSGQRVTTTDPTPHFYTSADQAAWVAAGEPPAAVPPSELTSVEEFGPGSASEVNGPLPLYDVSKLPTTPAALATVLGNENARRTTLGSLPAGISSLDYVSKCDTKTCALFERAVSLLQGPDLGATPALRAALYQVLAAVPGVRLLGSTTDQAGQVGVGLELVEKRPAGTTTEICAGQAQTTVSGRRVLVTPHQGTPSSSTTVTVPYGASTTTFTIVVDPKTTTLLSSGEAFSPSVSTTPLNPCLPAGTSPSTERLNPAWTIELNAGVVDSDTALPGAGTDYGRAKA